MIIDIKEIMKIIPHRQPMLLVDRVEIVEEDKKAVGFKGVTYNEPYFAGHFPQEPVMPGVLIMEAMAQTTAVLLLNKEEMRGKVGYYAGINKAKFRKKVVPGSMLRMEVEVIRQRGPLAVAYGKVYTDEGLAAEGEMTFMIG
ncbi:3-hydroxyacyl-ACP dehydratase FabZ [Frisingicoccus sp.]|uniref:3-hydroxyacyl-ACP dehydratase FabZ n=1 Tax=Frisingicoccus sp. TaxID=1918627 RepID=UPI002A7FB812|nr:3-hydroxyacyl-ACP dehydratase FabZ [Frisingicoccus sp.]MDY4833642.1 3-hydroxyacyl-ACP dehydratase FabZ [Frisingicoccus sp.]MDY4921424.1 3-hydroxyacyl-ACP dehydratase FabZ [Frisingicoccus sp.]